MARMSVDDMLGRDSRVARLARALGMSKLEVVGHLVVNVWPLCYDRLTPNLSEVDIDAATEIEGFAKAMVESELGTITKRGIRVSGAADRIGYLLERRESGRRGGMERAKRRADSNISSPSSAKAQPKLSSSSSQADPYHSSATASAPVSASVSAPVPALAPVPEIPDSAPPPAGGKAKRLLPESWAPERSQANLDAEAKARDRGVDLAVELEKLRDWSKTNNAKKADWDATWRNWTRNAKPSGPQRRSGQWTLQDQLDRVDMLERLERAGGQS